MKYWQTEEQKTLRETAVLYDIHTILGLEPGKGTYVCPFPQHVHSDNPTPSLGIKVMDDGVQRFHCFGTCSLRGDVIDAAGYINIPNYDPMDGEHVRRACSLLSQGFTPLDEPIRAAERVNLNPLLYRDFLPVGEKVIEYARRRGLTLATLEKFKVGERKGAMAIPTFEWGVLKGIKYRATWDNPNIRFWSEKGGRLGLFNHDGIVYTEDPVFVLKGEIPVMLADQLGFKACCPNSGEGVVDMTAWKHVLSFSQKVVVVGDNDTRPDVREKTQEQARKRAEALNARAVFPPEVYKDFDQFYLAEPNEALLTFKTWLGA